MLRLEMDYYAVQERICPAGALPLLTAAMARFPDSPAVQLPVLATFAMLVHGAWQRTKPEPET